IAAMAEVESVEVESVYGMEGGGVDRFELTMRGELGPDDVASLVMSSDLAGLEIEVRSDGRTAWVTSTDPSFTEALPTGARWVETSVDELRDQGFWEGSDSFVALLPVLRGPRRPRGRRHHRDRGRRGAPVDRARRPRGGALRVVARGGRAHRPERRAAVRLRVGHGHRRGRRRGPGAHPPAGDDRGARRGAVAHLDGLHAAPGRPGGRRARAPAGRGD